MPEITHEFAANVRIFSQSARVKIKQITIKHKKSPNTNSDYSMIARRSIAEPLF
ncbi:hypothetical protein EV201_0815 [Ancylomarina subtilis]|uniref:Uncharacterized protein n=1 Tax=Ancylomarina subtilis TaxID=1639035 RepID=A0A4Q7VJ24_9BACT|nr:hypothetical protein EV201_0815 [Ancylomarina subtilis]